MLIPYGVGILLLCICYNKEYAAQAVLKNKFNQKQNHGTTAPTISG
jgi:hypothetical protein